MYQNWHVPILTFNCTEIGCTEKRTESICTEIVMNRKWPTPFPDGPMCALPPNNASLGPPEYKSQTTSRSVKPFLHSTQQKRYTLQRDAFSPLNCPFPWENLNPIIDGSLGSPEPTTKTESRLVQPFFSQMTAKCPYTLQWPPFPLKIGPNLKYRGPSRLLNPNGISIGSAAIAEFTTMTDRQTRYSVCHNRPHIKTYVYAVRRCGLIITSGQSDLT